MSNLTSRPCWLSTHESETGKTEGINFGFDSSGMWFTGDASSGGEGVGAYPIRTNFEFEENDVCEVIYTVDYQTGCSDQGICIFNVGTQPEWNWGTNETRIAFSINCPTPYIYGLNNSTEGSGGELEGGEGTTEPNYYTFHFTYNPLSENVSVIVYQGTNTEVPPISTLELEEKLPPGNYKIGFDADQDSFGEKAYFTQVAIFKNGSVATSVAVEYTYDFSPDEGKRINSNWRYGSEGNLDTAVITKPDGTRTSVQRTGYFDYLDACGNRKSVSVRDGETVTDAPETPVVSTNPAGNPMVNPTTGSTI